MTTPHHPNIEPNTGLAIGVPDHVRLRQARTAHGLSLRQVADQCGINIRQYQKFEAGERDFEGCSFALGLRVCKVLELDPWEFMKGDVGLKSPAEKTGLEAGVARLQGISETEAKDDHCMFGRSPQAHSGGAV